MNMFLASLHIGSLCAIDGLHVGLTKGTLYNVEIVRLTSTGKPPFQMEPKTAMLKITATVRDLTGKPLTQTWSYPKPVNVDKLKKRYD